MNTKVTESGYRVEERRTIGATAYLMVWSICWDDRDEGLSSFDRIVSNAAARGGDYEPDSRFRLVLLGPDRTVLP